MEKGDSDVESIVRLNRYYAAPIKNGEALGKVVFIKDGKEIAAVDLISRENIYKAKKAERN